MKFIVLSLCRYKGRLDTRKEDVPRFYDCYPYPNLINPTECSTPVCQTRIRVSGYSSNPNPGSGNRIFDLPFTVLNRGQISWVEQPPTPRFKANNPWGAA